MTKRVYVVAAAFAASLVLIAGCGSNGTSSADASSGSSNEASSIAPVSSEASIESAGSGASHSSVSSASSSASSPSSPSSSSSSSSASSAASSPVASTSAAASSTDGLEAIEGSFWEGSFDDEGNPYVTESKAKEALTFTLEGVEYSLPFKLQDLVDDGWVVSNDMSQKAFDGHWKYGNIALSKDGQRGRNIYVDVTSAKDGEVPFEDGVVYGIWVDEEDFYGGGDVDFQTSAGIGFGSSPDDAFTTYGRQALTVNHETDGNEWRVVLKNDGQSSTWFGEIRYKTLKDDLFKISLEVNEYSTNPMMSAFI